MLICYNTVVWNFQLKHLNKHNPPPTYVSSHLSKLNLHTDKNLDPGESR